VSRARGTVGCLRRHVKIHRDLRHQGGSRMISRSKDQANSGPNREWKRSGLPRIADGGLRHAPSRSQRCLDRPVSFSTAFSRLTRVELTRSPSAFAAVAPRTSYGLHPRAAFLRFPCIHRADSSRSIGLRHALNERPVSHKAASNSPTMIYALVPRSALSSIPSGSNLSATGEARDVQWMKAPPR
jgi:hypothetical protein